MGKQWKKAGKTENAAKKGLIVTKIAREIQVAAKLGGGDVNFNARLRLAVDHAKKNAVPNDTIERAIKKGSGLLSGATIEEITYEGYGPHGVGVIVECQSDNRNRTASEIRTVFKTNGGNLGELGSVMWMFERVCLIECTKEGSFDAEEEAIEAGANEVEKHDGSYSFYGPLENMEEIKQTLTSRGWKITGAELSFRAKNITELTDAQMEEVQDFLGELEDFDDSHRVYATLK